ncbi:phage head closure protein [Achromobacter spanius]|uniref:phage head closure protein n=1 Tax=Achromobacter spanius TaxID=217203 RepID=UPI002227AB92|nr:phage head closure protein [Achromobacter spanius]MCW3151946.1 phage head closure protein [Achromobacter spanius]
MSAGKRNRLVELLRRSTERDEANELIDAWVVVGSAWASIRFISGVAAIKAGAEQEVTKASIRLTYRRNVEMGMRVRHGTDVYRVEVVLPDEEHRKHVDLVCRLLSAREV